MYNILHNSKSGMSASQNKINITSNNIANSQTSGYKKLDAGFLDLFTETLDRKSYPNNSANNVTGTGVKVSEAVRNMSQGALKSTEIETNLAIDGDGFFAVIGPNGAYKYTRNGEFNLDGEGRLVDNYGNFLEVTYNNEMNPANVNLANGELNINEQGEIFLDGNNIGKINLYMPTGNNDLTSVGDSMFVLNENANMYIVEDTNILQGYAEMSNVDMSQEMTDLIMLQRAFQFNSSAMKSVDEMWGMINNLQGR